MFFILRGLAYHFFLYVVVFLMSTLLVPLHLFVPRVHSYFYYYQSRVFSFFLLRTAGVRLYTNGVRHFRELGEKSCILISNHVTTLDVPIQLRALREYNVSIVYSHRLVSGIPLIGPLVMRVFNSFGWIGIKRGGGDISGLKELIADALNGKRKRIILSVYPEGNRSLDGALLPFQKGAFYLAMRLQLPIVPILMQGVSPLHRRGTFAVRGGPVGVDVLPPIYPPKLTASNPKEFKKQLKQGTDALQTQAEKIYTSVPNLNWDAQAYRKSLNLNKNKKEESAEALKKTHTEQPA